MKSKTDWRVDLPCAGRADLSALTVAEYDELLWQHWRAEATAPAVLHPSPIKSYAGAKALPMTTWLGPARGFHDAK